MYRLISAKIRSYSSYLSGTSEGDWATKLKDRYGLGVPEGSNTGFVKAMYDMLEGVPSELVRDCGITQVGFEDLGPSKKYYPNHGKYCDGSLVLNTRLFDDKSVFEDDTGKKLSKLALTFLHELGHGFDEKMGEDRWLCMEPDWLNLSRWSSRPVPGLRRVTIREKDCPDLVGEWYYSGDAEFPRFYGKRNPWDDWADAFGFYVGGLKGKICESKRKYFDERLRRYF